MKPCRARPLLDGFCRATAGLVLPRGWNVAARALLAQDPDLRRIVVEVIDSGARLAEIPGLAAARYAREVT